MLCAICCMLYTICYVLYAICYKLYAICYLLPQREGSKKPKNAVWAENHSTSNRLKTNYNKNVMNNEAFVFVNSRGV